MLKKLFVPIQLILKFTGKMRDDFVASFSAQAAFFIIISAFPFVMFLLTLIQYLPITESTLLNLATQYTPKTVTFFIVTIITEVYDRSSGTIISITAITALWSASKGFFAIMNGLNTVYGISETRNYFRIRILATFYTLMFALMLICTLFFLIFGNSMFLYIQESVPHLENLALLIISLRTTVILFVLVTFFTFMYLFIPNRRSKLRYELPGALISAAGWMLFSYAYSYYIDHMKDYSNTYGSLTAIVLLMLWLYACMYILFIGAELNSVIRNLRDKDLRLMHLCSSDLK